MIKVLPTLLIKDIDMHIKETLESKDSDIIVDLHKFNGRKTDNYKTSVETVNSIYDTVLQFMSVVMIQWNT